VSGRTAVVATLAIAFGMGLYSFVAIKRTAGRRVSLVEEVAASVPAIPGARVISPWEPATYADDVRAMYCLDGADPTTGASRAINALTAAGWTTTETRRDQKADTYAFLMDGPVVRLRGGVSFGARPDCDGAKHQVTLALDGTR
jgi:hypothetical protein